MRVRHVRQRGTLTSIAFEVNTDRARRVWVKAGEEALRNHASEIGNEHALVAIARDAMTPWPATEEPPVERLGRLPLKEDPSMALRVLTELGVTPDALAVETCRVAGLIAPSRLSEPGPSLVDAGRPPSTLGSSAKLAMGLELAWARRRHDNHLSTLHLLYGISSTRSSPLAREALANLGIPNPRTIEHAARVVEDQREKMCRQMLVLALDDNRLRKSLAEMFPGSTSGLRWKRKKLLRTSPASGQA
jgi:hypothetical protein